MLLYCGASAPVAAQQTAETPATPSQATVQALVQGLHPPGTPEADKAVPVTVRVRGQDIRIDFDPAWSHGFYLLHSGDQSGAWMIDRARRVALPVADSSGPYWLDPGRPCATIGGRCSPATREVIAGRVANGWQYRGAERGPDGTVDGTLWVDVRTGLLLGYRSSVPGQSGTRSLRVLQVSFDEIPAEMFTAPQDMAQAAPEARP